MLAKPLHRRAASLFLFVNGLGLWLEFLEHVAEARLPLAAFEQRVDPELRFGPDEFDEELDIVREGRLGSVGGASKHVRLPACVDYIALGMQTTGQIEVVGL